MNQIVKNAEELFYEPVPLQQHRIDNFLTNGLTLLCGAPKSRKSWMVLDLGVRVASGQPFFERETHPCGVLYYALEDTFSRLTNRLHQLMDEDPPESLRIATECPPLGYGFEENVSQKLRDYPDTKLIIVDTLQKIRSGDNPNLNAYGLDYHECSQIKKLADEKDISILVVHHTKKLPDPSDPLNMVSGTNGIAGSADTVMVLIPEKRFGSNASLYIVGRDMPQQEMVLRRGNILWELEDVKDEEW